MKQYVVDAFTDKVFAGNPAAICVIDQWLPEELMMNITRENNLSETAFIVKEQGQYRLRWFTPGGEKVQAGRQSRDIADRFTQMFESDCQVLVFPAGLCARTFKGVITEMPWKKMFITQARKYERDVVPVHISGHNSKWYFFLSWLSRTLKLKMNLGMLFLVDELFNKAGEEFVISFGKPIPYTDFDSSKTDLQWADYVKDIVKKLSLDNGCTPNM